MGASYSNCDCCRFEEFLNDFPEGAGLIDSFDEKLFSSSESIDLFIILRWCLKTQCNQKSV